MEYSIYKEVGDAEGVKKWNYAGDERDVKDATGCFDKTDLQIYKTHGIVKTKKGVGQLITTSDTSWRTNLALNWPNAYMA